MQAVAVLLYGPSLKQARPISASTHPELLAHLCRDLVELEDDDSPEVKEALVGVLTELARDTGA